MGELDLLGDMIKNAPLLATILFGPSLMTFGISAFYLRTYANQAKEERERWEQERQRWREERGEWLIVLGTLKTALDELGKAFARFSATFEASVSRGGD
jgi:hypothetical protein